MHPRYADQHTYDVEKFFDDNMTVEEKTLRKVDRAFAKAPRNESDPAAEAVIVMLAVSRLQEMDLPTLTGAVWENLQKASDECARILATLGIVFHDGTPDYTISDEHLDAEK